MKKMGVLGGIGPQATMQFEAAVHRVSQRLIPRRFNGGYPPMIVEYLRRPPWVLNDDGTPALPLTLEPSLLESARRLGSMCDFLVVPCNSVHLFIDTIERASGVPSLNMVDVVLNEVHRRNWSNVGVLGMGEPVVYTRRLAELNIAHTVIDKAAQEQLAIGILQVMEGSETDESRTSAKRAVEALREKQADGIILGCTEIPFLIGDERNAPDLIDPVMLLAEAAVRFAFS